MSLRPTWHWIVLQLFIFSVVVMTALRLFKLPVTELRNSLGTMISTYMMGSISCQLPSMYACLIAPSAACTNENSDESTAWLAPSSRRNLTPVTLLPESTPFSSDCKNPFLTAGTNCAGMFVPEVSLENSVEVYLLGSNGFWWKRNHRTIKIAHRQGL